jgi:hypothetical protein
MTGFIDTSVTSSLNYTQLQRYRYSTHFQFTVARALGSSVFTGRLLATDLKTETSTSNHYEVFLPFLVQSPWNLGTQRKTLLAARGLALYSRGTDNAETPVLLLRDADHRQNN